MADPFSINCNWSDIRSDEAEIGYSMANLQIRLNNENLTENENTWSKTIEDSVLTSAYPLAYWICSSWWRLLYEPLPPSGMIPSTDWRLSHELASANSGFVWPKIIFASDNRVVQIWSAPTERLHSQSVRYLTGLPEAVSVPISDLAQSFGQFIGAVLSRLGATTKSNSELLELWNAIRNESENPSFQTERIFEAQLGFDADECPEELLQTALELSEEIGGDTLSEISPIYGRVGFGKFRDLCDSIGLMAHPDLSPLSLSFDDTTSHVSRAHSLSKWLRSELNIGERPVEDSELADLLGIETKRLFGWEPAPEQRISLGIRENGSFRFYPRKRHPMARRFEIARIIADLFLFGNDSSDWIASTDLKTFRQKYQRAFAAEFLCPISALSDFLDWDFSESKIEEAAEYFQASTQTIESHLANNNLIQRTWASLPYETTPFAAALLG